MTALNSADRPARPGAILRIGDVLVSEGLATPAQVQSALCDQYSSQTYRPLGHILIAQNVITRRQLMSVLVRYRRSAKLGQLLIMTKAVTLDQLAAGLTEQRRAHRRLGQVLVELKHITEEQLRRALCLQLHINFFDLDTIVPDTLLGALINPRFAEARLVVPMARVGNTLVVAMDDPTQTAVIEELRSSTGLEIEVITSTTARIRGALGHLYRPHLPADADRHALRASAFEPSPLETTQIVGEPHAMKLDELDRVSGDVAPIQSDMGRANDSTSGLVRQLLTMAIEQGASDIHLEAVDHGVQVRFRIDGVLQEPRLDGLEQTLSSSRGKLMSRLKILSKLDIAERRRPQDGSFRARLERDGQKRTVDFRVSVIAGYYGESAVIRILDPRGLPRSIDDLGLREPIAARLGQLLRCPTGLILVTGPTGSGKSTTLFGALKTIYQPGIKILTAENPIEYICDGFSQHEVDDRIGNTFATYLRSFLRHDPDVIMVGEIRDTATAELAFRAAQTGHLVLSTLHTNDAVSALPRLMDLGVDTNLIASCLLGVLSQRLVREVCSECREISPPSQQPLSKLFASSEYEWYRGRGCGSCNYTGYRGRMVLAELWTPNQADMMLINRGAPFAEICLSAEKSTLAMADDVSDKLRQGRTNLEELVRTLPHSALRKLQLTPRGQSSAISGPTPRPAPTADVAPERSSREATRVAHRSPALA